MLQGTDKTPSGQNICVESIESAPLHMIDIDSSDDPDNSLCQDGMPGERVDLNYQSNKKINSFSIEDTMTNGKMKSNQIELVQNDTGIKYQPFDHKGQ